MITRASECRPRAFRNYRTQTTLAHKNGRGHRGRGHSPRHRYSRDNEPPSRPLRRPPSRASPKSRRNRSVAGVRGFRVSDDRLARTGRAGQASACSDEQTLVPPVPSRPTRSRLACPCCITDTPAEKHLDPMTGTRHAGGPGSTPAADGVEAVPPCVCGRPFRPFTYRQRYALISSGMGTGVSPLPTDRHPIRLQCATPNRSPRATPQKKRAERVMRPARRFKWNQGCLPSASQPDSLQPKPLPRLS
jgi:hypothetical protein